MSALGKQGLQIVRRAAATAAEIDLGPQPSPDELPESVGAAAASVPKRVRGRKRKQPSAPALPLFDRAALRLKLEAASARPAPGSSELLSRPLQTEVVVGHTRRGNKLSMVESHDLTQMAPIHLLMEGFKP